MKEYVQYILVPIDFSDYSLKATLLALEFAEGRGVDVVFLHAYASLSTKKDSLKHVRHFQDYLSMLREEGKYKSVTFSIVLKRGIPEEEIQKYVKDNPPIFVIMGTRAADQKDSDLIGSVTAEVLSFIPSPMIVVPDKIDISLQSYKEAEKICYATNFSASDIVVFLDLMQRIQRDTFDIRFVHVIEKGKAASAMQPYITRFETAVRERYPYLKCSYHLLPSEGDITQTLNNYVRDNKIDILAVKQPNGKGLYNRLVASLAQKLVYSAKNPLLVLPYMEAPNHEKRSMMVSLNRNLQKVNFFNRKR